MMERMTEAKYIKPKFREGKFNCPHCHVYAVQTWLFEIILNMKNKESFRTFVGKGYFDEKNIDMDDRNCLAKCLHCGKLSIWTDKKMIYPATPSAPAPVDDMPKGVKKIYEEARLVEPHSKRAAMVLLRVSLERLMLHLQMKGKTLHEKSKNLEKKGVTEEAVRWLLAVKGMGNEAAHIANIDPNDKEIVEKLNKVFTTINLIVTVTITLKNMADDLTKKQPKNANQTKKNP